MPYLIGAVKAGAMNLIRQRVFFFSGRGSGVDLAGPLTAVTLYYRVPRDGVL